VEIDDSEYELNISQAKLFQNHLAASGRPKRLLSEAELAEKEKLAQERKSKIETVCNYVIIKQRMSNFYCFLFTIY